jgi:hypothetical protein
MPCECEDLSYLSALAKGRRSPASEGELTIRPLGLDPVCNFFAMPEPRLVDYLGRFENAAFPFLTAPEILRALQTFRC